MKHVLVYGMTDNPGGIETYLLNFFQRVQGHGVMLDFVSDFAAVSGSNVLEQGGATIYRIPAKSKDLWGHLRGIWKILMEHREYTSVYFNILDAGAAVTMIPVFLAGRKIVVHSHNNDTEKKRLHKLCKPFLNLMASGRAACSEAAADYMFGKTAKNTLIVPNAIDAAKFAFSEEVRAEKRRALHLGNRPCICHVGRIAQQKNPFGLIDIFEAVHRKCPEAMLLSVGDGELMGEFRRYIADKGLNSAVICLGARNDVAELYSAADVFLFPSLYEGLGIVVLEAQAAGLPCVISDVIPKQAWITDLVCPVPLTAEPDVWADRVLMQLGQPRKDSYREIVAAGYDISCCSSFDEKLVDMF